MCRGRGWTRWVYSVTQISPFSLPVSYNLTMFARKQPPPDPLITFKVSKPVGVDKVTANRCYAKDGVLSFYVDDRLVRAYSPQNWLTVEPEIGDD